MSKMPWFRMYTDFLNDPKMIALAFEDQRHFIGVLALKSDGALDQDCPADLLDRIVAQRLWIDHAIIRDVKRRLMAAGLVDEYWQPLGWEKRQMRSDSDPSGAERQRRFREKKKEENGSNALRNAPVTPPDKEEETDKEEEKIKTKPRARAAAPAVDFSEWPSQPSDEVWADYVKHRKAKKAPLTQTAVNGIGREAKKAWLIGYSVDAFLTECMQRGWQGGKAEWLEGSPKKAGARPQTQAQRNADWTSQLWKGSQPAAGSTIDMGVIDATAN